MLQHWRSNGKIILTGEYLVLFGTKALATPLKIGQSLDVESDKGRGILNFTTYQKNKEWFKAIFETATLELIHTNNRNSADYVLMVLRAAQKLNENFLSYTMKYNAVSNIEFNVEWGFGTSSSLISNIAWWANVDPFEINRLVSLGSSYDIACARSDTPIFYTYNHNMPIVEPVQFKPSCSSQFWMVYTGKKETTEVNLDAILHTLKPHSSEIDMVSDLSEEFSKADSIPEFSKIISEHEKVLSGILKKEPIRQKLFKDFNGAVKSLGAWGGDFCLAVTQEPESYVRQYFEQKGLTTVLSFNEMVI